MATYCCIAQIAASVVQKQFYVFTFKSVQIEFQTGIDITRAVLNLILKGHQLKISTEFKLYRKMHLQHFFYTI
jgi:hypothetical protein